MWEKNIPGEGKEVAKSWKGAFTAVLRVKKAPGEEVVRTARKG